MSYYGGGSYGGYSGGGSYGGSYGGYSGSYGTGNTYQPYQTSQQTPGGGSPGGGSGGGMPQGGGRASPQSQPIRQVIYRVRQGVQTQGEAATGAYSSAGYQTGYAQNANYGGAQGSSAAQSGSGYSPMLILGGLGLAAFILASL